MGSVADRIEQAEACKVINLSEVEKDLYHGCGWKLARFHNGTLVELFDPCNVAVKDDTSVMVQEAIENATTWLAKADGEIFLVMCSCYQLCEPTRASITDKVFLEHMEGAFFEQLYDPEADGYGEDDMMVEAHHESLREG